jgi:hypothetical protein
LRAVRCSCDARRVPRPARAIGASPGSPARFRLFGVSCASRPGHVAARSAVRVVPPGDDCESHRDHASVVRSAVHLARISSVSSSPCLVRLPLSRRARAQPRTHSPARGSLVSRTRRYWQFGVVTKVANRPRPPPRLLRARVARAPATKKPETHRSPSPAGWDVLVEMEHVVGVPASLDF